MFIDKSSLVSRFAILLFSITSQKQHEQGKLVLETEGPDQTKR